MSSDLLALALDADMSDEEIKDCIQQMMPICMARGIGFCLTISGFDKDKRELWQIPKAIHFMKRLVESGLIAGLEVSTQCTELVREEYKIEKLPGFGALEVWLGGTGRLGTGLNNLDKTVMKEFLAELNKANHKAEALCKEPSYNTGIKTKIFDATIPDGSTRHGCPKWNK